MFSRVIDRAFDWTVVPGYSRLGYALRSRSWDEAESQARLDGWTVLVTGASAGIGAAAAERFARAGASVHMLARNRERGEDARARISEATGSDRLVLELCDISDLGAVREFATRFAAEHPELHVLVNNAGVMPPERTLTPEGHELTFATNVLGPFLLTSLLLPALRNGAPSRVVNVSSGGMYSQKLDGDDLELTKRDYEPAAFYAHTKRAEVILTELWAERLRGTGISVNSMHPGWADTPGVQTSRPRFRKLMRPLLRDADQAADTIFWLASAPEPAATPGLFWHDREPRPIHRVPWTREAPADRERLWAECERITGARFEPAAAAVAGA
jgi:NAD(P)-dependent dehydrogenase (short-subunit alcohol dehydrogenase family)